MYMSRTIGRRYYSTALDEIKAAFKSGESLVVVGNIADAVAKSELEEVHQFVESINESSELLPVEQTELLNKVLASGLGNDFSLYFKTPKTHQWLSEALELLVRANPGRVDPLWHLWSKHGALTTPALLNAVLEKLLIGEKVELREEEVELTVDRIVKALKIVEMSGESDISQDLLSKLILASAELKILLGVGSALAAKQLARYLTSKEIPDPIFRRIFSLVFHEDPSLLDTDSLLRALGAQEKAEDITALDNALGDFNKERMANGNEEYVPGSSDLVSLDELASYIETTKLDRNNTPESLVFRLKLVVCHGVYRSDMPKALELYHYYQSHAKHGIELVQINMSSLFCYQAIQKHSEIDLKIAETLIGKQLPVNLISHLILANAEFSDEKAMDVYNSYIPSVSRKPTSNGLRAPLTILTESMMLASLYNNDREFANLLYEKAVQNLIFGSEPEAASTRNLFKVYGEAFAEDTWESAKPKLKDYVLNYLKKLMM